VPEAEGALPPSKLQQLAGRAIGACILVSPFRQLEQLLRGAANGGDLRVDGFEFFARALGVVLGRVS
jgi:hypothetical protein